MAAGTGTLEVTLCHGQDLKDVDFLGKWGRAGDVWSASAREQGCFVHAGPFHFIRTPAHCSTNLLQAVKIHTAC